MKIPYSVDKNFFKIYEPSPVALSLVQDSQRRVKSEDATWDENHIPKLSYLCVMTVSANFEKKLLLGELPCWDRDYLLEILPTDLPLDVAVLHIHHEVYWERRVKERWQDRVNYCRGGVFCWKKLYLERHVQEAIEAMTPEGFDLEVVDKLCNLTGNFVEILNLRELQNMKPPILTNDDDDFTSYEEPSNHIDLDPIITGFYYLKELHLQFGVRNVGAEYKKSLFQFSIQDCINLGEGIGKSENLHLLHLHSCDLDDPRLLALLSRMEKNETLEELDFSNCLISDEGATALAKFMKSSKKLKSLSLRNNKVGEEGVANIAFMLGQRHCCPLEKLNLKFNKIGDAGFKYLTSGLVRDVAHMKHLNVACCGLTKESAIFLAETLKRNSILLEVDISNNCLGEEGGRALKEAVVQSTTILNLDLRMTQVDPDDMVMINDTLCFNRIRAYKGEPGVVREIKMRQKRAAEIKLRLEQEAAAAAAEAAKAAEKEAANLAEKEKAKEEDD